MIYTALEIKTFGLGSTIGDIFSEILSNIALCVTSGNEGWPQYLFYLRLQPRPWIRKVRTSRDHPSVEKRTIMETWYTSYFFRNKTFLFVKIESSNFQHQFDLGFHEPLQNFSSFRQTFRQLFSMGNKSCLNELKFCEVSRNNKSKRC